MLPLTIACIFGGCLDMPIDTRPLHTQIWQDQLGGNERVVSCYSGNKFYEDCSKRDPWGFGENENDYDQDF